MKCKLTEPVKGAADVLLSNSQFSAGVFNMFFSIPRKPQVVYPGINFSAYDPPPDLFDDKKCSRDYVVSILMLIL